jgi:ferredoxin
MSAHVEIDRDLCIGSGTCVRLAPAVFALDAEEIAIVLDPGAVEPTRLQLAADACPTEAIRIGGPHGPSKPAMSRTT